MASVYSTGLRVRKISSTLLKNSSEKKIQGFAQWQKSVKLGELAITRNSFFLGEKNPKT